MEKRIQELLDKYKSYLRSVRKSLTYINDRYGSDSNEYGKEQELQSVILNLNQLNDNPQDIYGKIKDHIMHYDSLLNYLEGRMEGFKGHWSAKTYRELSGRAKIVTEIKRDLENLIAVTTPIRRLVVRSQ